MPDTRFFPRPEQVSLGFLADRTGAKLNDPAYAELVIHDVAPLDTAGQGDISFFDNKKYRDAFRSTKAGACFIAPAEAGFAPSHTALLLTPHPHKAYARTAQIFYPEAMPIAAIAPTARIGDGCVIHQGTAIDDHVVIGPSAMIGRNCQIEANAVVGAGVVIGDNCRIGANASVSHAILGNRVRLYAGCRVGQDGFGFAIDPDGYVKVPQLGRVIIEDDVEIGANTCIDRGAGPDTVIGQGTWIDNLVQIGHNVRIGKGCVIVAQVGVSGSTVLEDYVMLGGQAGLTGHLRIGKGARVGAQTGVMSDLAAGVEYMGSPALPIRQHLRHIAYLKRATRPKAE